MSGLSDGQKPWWPSRYGREDQIGTLNEIAPEVVRAASALIKTGAVVDLGRVLDEDTPKFRGRYWHQTVDVAPQVGTQLDSIGHIQIGDRFYNGWTTRDIVESWGLNRFGMETVPPIVTRGVLVDVAAYRGVECLQGGYVITPSDLEGSLKRQGLEVRAGYAAGTIAGTLTRRYHGFLIAPLLPPLGRSHGRGHGGGRVARTRLACYGELHVDRHYRR